MTKKSLDHDEAILRFGEVLPARLAPYIVGMTPRQFDAARSKGKMPKARYKAGRSLYFGRSELLEAVSAGDSTSLMPGEDQLNGFAEVRKRKERQAAKGR